MTLNKLCFQSYIDKNPEVLGMQIRHIFAAMESASSINVDDAPARWHIRAYRERHDYSEEPDFTVNSIRLDDKLKELTKKGHLPVLIEKCTTGKGILYDIFYRSKIDGGI